MGFPISPDTGELYSIGNISYEWNGLAWDIHGTSLTNKGSAPAAGSDAYVLAKASNDDYDMEWIDIGIYVKDNERNIINSSGTAVPTKIHAELNIKTDYNPSSYSAHRIMIQLDAVNGASVGFKTEPIHVATVNLNGRAVVHTDIEDASHPLIANLSTTADKITFDYTSKAVAEVFNDGGANNTVAGVYRLSLWTERVSGIQGDILFMFGAPAMGITSMV